VIFIHAWGTFPWGTLNGFTVQQSNMPDAITDRGARNGS